MKSETESEQFRIGTFPLALIVTAIAINSFFLTRPAHRVSDFPPTPVLPQPLVTQSPTIEAAPPQPTPEQIAATARANFLARYVNPGVERKAGVQAVAVVVAGDKGQQSRAVSEVLTRKLKTAGIEFQPSFFKPAFIADGVFDKAFNGSALPLPDVLDALLLAREGIQYEKHDSALANSLTAHVRLDVSVIPLAANFQSQTWSFMANGAGFSQPEALLNAEERLQKQIVQNTNMTLIK